jgi:multidrug efflux pump subunit AcrA (membrane-fusion protein)
MSIRFNLTRCIGAFILCSLALAAGAQDEAAARVETVPLGELVMQPEISAAASVESLSDSRISAELNATIKTIPVRVGDIVAPGDILVQLDCSDYELRADELTARLEAGTARAGLARQQLQRARKLESSRTMSQEVLDQREAELVSLAAEAAAQQALLNQINHERGKCTLRAPF